MKNSFLKNLCIVFSVLLLFALIGCNEDKSDEMLYSEKLSIVCTTFPQYDWVCNIVGDNPDIEISLIMNNGVEPHSYQASADDIIKIKKSDIFIYNGGISDTSFHKIAEQNKRENWITINMMDEIKEALLYEEHSSNDGHEHHNIVYDEHIWLSLKNSITLCEIITDKLVEVDPLHENQYRENCKIYTNSLEIMDKEYQKTIEKAKRVEFILVDRNPFRYLINDYNLSCYSAFPGCSSETEASFNTIISLGQKIDELQCTHIAVTEKGDMSISKAVQEASNSKNLSICTLNSIQSVTLEEIESGCTYISAMEQNLSALKILLN